MENRFIGSISASTIKNFFPKSSVSTKSKMMMKSALRRNKSNSENIPPIDSNIQISDPPLLPSSSFPKKSPSKAIIVHKQVARSENQVEVPAPLSDSPVKVVVRIKPSSGLGLGDCAVKKVSNDSVTIGDRRFIFDSVFDANSTQEDIFQLVGVPLVNDALAGYNTSILAYGQSGSGKTYTMWGPPSAMVESPSTDGLQGIVPRIFEMLFSKIKKDQENSEEGRQINYQCRCSFFEIHNEQIGDLLDPTQRNLEIKDDNKHGFYVEYLTEEYVTSYEDVTHILIKGLSCRKVGATSTNSKSSRSHIVFTCNIESWCKDTSSKCFGSSKTSRISLIDLAGFEKNILDDAGKQCLKEAKFVKKSTSHLGNLINSLVERSHSGITKDNIPYGSSFLTQFLRESLGGNAKLSVICAISPDNKFSGETASTLRFGQRVKFVQNEPVINKISEDDVNDLSDQIRLLKEELIRAKSNASDSVGNHGYFKGRNVRESLNQLRLSINRSLILPSIDNDCEEVCANENDVKELQAQIDGLRSSREEDLKDTEDCSETDFTSEQYVSCSEESDTEEISSKRTHTEVLHQNEISAVNDLDHTANDSAENDFAVRPSILITARHHSEVLEEPTFTESPKIKNLHRKSLVLSANSLANQEVGEEICIKSESVRHSNQIRSSLRSSRIFPGPTESLAASLHRGLEIIDYHQRKSTLDRSSVSFSFEHLALKPSSTVDNEANDSVQTLPGDRQSFLCRKCRQRGVNASIEVEDSLKTLVPVDEANSKHKLDSEEATERQKELESVCKEQATKIEQLNQLLIKHKIEVEGSSGPDLPNDDGNKLLMWNDDTENQNQELIKEKCEIKEIQEHFVDSQKNQSFDTDEREALLKEIECLRNTLRSQSDAATTNKSTDRIRSSLLAQSIQLRKSGAFLRGNNSEEDIEKERERWTEMESEWICLTDELRIDLESYRQKAEKVEMELRLEKKCTEELDDALSRSILGHGRMVEHYAELQEKYNELAERHRLVMQGVAEVKKAAAKAGAKGHGSRFAKSLAKELSALRVERDRERELLRKENKSLKTQLKDTAEAVHAAGEVLVRLKEAEESASFSEENFTRAQEDNEKLKKQIEKLKRKHKMEMITMKQYLAGSRLPESALGPSLYMEDSDIGRDDATTLTEDDDQAWRAEFGPIYQDHY